MHKWLSNLINSSKRLTWLSQINIRNRTYNNKTVKRLNSYKRLSNYTVRPGIFDFLMPVMNGLDMILIFEYKFIRIGNSHSLSLPFVVWTSDTPLFSDDDNILMEYVEDRLIHVYELLSFLQMIIIMMMMTILKVSLILFTL